MLSPSLEDYLEEVYRLSINKKEIRVKDIADCLGVSMPSVVKGLRRLHCLEYILYLPYEKIQVLDKGKKRGRFLVERNRILREFFEIIGSDCDVKQEAEAIEHYLTVSTIRKIEKLIMFFNENKKILEELRSFKIESILDECKINIE